MKQLVINADDFGFTRDVNAGIVHAHREGVLTATTLMANGGAFEDAVRLADENPTLDVGCHLALVQGDSLLTGHRLPRTVPRMLLDVMARRLDPYAEFRVQVETVLAAGIRPSHLDTHKHTHIAPPVFRAVVQLAAEFEIPFLRIPVPAAANAPLRRAYSRFAESNGVRMVDHFTGFRLTGCLTEDTFSDALRKTADGVTEFMCHPGFAGPELHAAETRLKDSRLLELEALISPRIRQQIERDGIRLCSFREITSSAGV